MYAGVGKNGRPVRNTSTAVPVEFGLGLIQMDLDEKYKVLIMSMWSRYVSDLWLQMSNVILIDILYNLNYLLLWRQGSVVLTLISFFFVFVEMEGRVSPMGT